MNKKVIFIGLGVLVLGGAAYFLLAKKSPTGGATGDSTEGQRAADQTGSAANENYGDTTAALDTLVNPTGTRKEMRQERRQVRRDCHAEAKANGLKGKAKREYRKACKAAGGVDDGAAFAFNGYGWDVDNVGF